MSEPEGLQFWNDAVAAQSRLAAVHGIIRAVVEYDETNRDAIHAQQFLDWRLVIALAGLGSRATLQPPWPRCRSIQLSSCYGRMA